jgi:hypothetical protein
MYLDVIPRFERGHGVRVDIQRADFQSFEARLQSAIVADTDVADLAEMPEATLGFFTRGPENDSASWIWRSEFRRRGSITPSSRRAIRHGWCVAASKRCLTTCTRRCSPIGRT